MERKWEGEWAIEWVSPHTGETCQAVVTSISLDIEELAELLEKGKTLVNPAHWIGWIDGQEIEGECLYLTLEDWQKLF